MKGLTKPVLKISLSFIFFLLVTLLVLAGFFKYLDLSLGHLLIRLDNSSFGGILHFFRVFGHDEASLYFLCGIAISAFILKFRKYFLCIIAVFFIMIMTNQNLKSIIHRQRPSVEFYDSSYEKDIANLKHNSYPSGHVLRSSFLFLSLGALIAKLKIRKNLKAALTALIYFVVFMVGFSSVCIGAHWASDVIGAFLLSYFFYQILALSSFYTPLAKVNP